MSEEKEKWYYCWEEFTAYCELEGIPLEDEDDWKPWWDCWKTGIDAANN